MLRYCKLFEISQARVLAASHTANPQYFGNSNSFDYLPAGSGRLLGRHCPLAGLGFQRDPEGRVKPNLIRLIFPTTAAY